MAAAAAAMSASISAARSAENRDDIALQLFEVQDQVRELQLQQHESNVRIVRASIERRDATIRVLQAQCDALTHELHEVRTRSEQTQRTLEDALLERSIEVAELRASNSRPIEALLAACVFSCLERYRHTTCAQKSLPSATHEHERCPTPPHSQNTRRQVHMLNPSRGRVSRRARSEHRRMAMASSSSIACRPRCYRRARHPLGRKAGACMARRLFAS